jgi:hypothetical protein
MAKLSNEPSKEDASKATTFKGATTIFYTNYTVFIT